MLSKRDKAVIEDLNRFRVMDRDSISELHFSNMKNPKDSCNHVLLRLLRDGHIQRSQSFVPYVYFGPNVKVKHNSAKIGHFLSILEVYKEMLRSRKNLTEFTVEPKYGSKGTVEPDIFCIYRNTPFFIEVQRTLYSEKQMNEKMKRYEDLYHSGIMKPFPHVFILSEQRYSIDIDLPFKLFQAQSFTQFNQSLRPDHPVIQNKTETNLKLKIN
jgi:hypothetical protein